MNLAEKILITLITVHIVTVICLFLSKNSRFLEKFRSSDTHPANKGKTAVQVGGLVVIPVAILSALLFLNSTFKIPLEIQLIYSLPVLMLFMIGIIDDYKPLSASIRLVIHFANAISITILIYQLTEFSGIKEVTSFTGLFLPALVMVFAISWMINTTNFIDGMDLFLIISILPGIALFSLLHSITGQEFGLSIIFAILLFTLLGFVWFNWPKASIYMGDAGTLSIGFLISACGVYILAKYGSIAGFIPFSLILTDTTFTLFSRISNKLNPFKSHNQHAYQVASQNGLADTTIRSNCLIINLINTFLAYLCFEYDYALFWQLIAGACAFLLSVILYLFFKNNKKQVQ